MSGNILFVVWMIGIVIVWSLVGGVFDSLIGASWMR